MNTQRFLFLLIGLVLGSIAGFLFTNTINRNEHDKLRAEITRLNANSRPGDRDENDQTASGQMDLSDEELRKAIAKGDADPSDTTLQRNLGHGLYLYAMKLGKPELLPDAIRMLKRAHEANPKDYETTVALGNSLFDKGQLGDAGSFEEARGYYLKALAVKPNDVNVRTDLGLTYYFDKPSDPRRAIKEYRQSLAVEPKHEMTLQNLGAALIEVGEVSEAEKRLDELERVNSQNSALSNLRAQLALKKNALDSSASGASAKEPN